MSWCAAFLQVAGRTSSDDANVKMNAGKREGIGVRRVEPGVVRLIAGCLLVSLAACGAPVSEKGPGPAASVSGGATTSQNARGVLSSGQPDADANERDNRSIPGVPDRVVRDLGSVDPRDRYRALEHWNVKGGTAPLDPVFEALEDEDEAVRAKAEAIVEKRWAEEQQKERG